MTRKKAATIEHRGPIAIVRFDRGERLNAFDAGLVEELTEVALSFRNDLQTQVIIVTGAPTYFSSGADLKDDGLWGPERTALERRHILHGGVRLCKAWEELSQVTIAAINGLVVGAGAAFALACDWRVMDRTAYMYVPEVKIGLNLQWGTVPRLVQMVGPARAKRITLLCEKVGAEQVFDWGLVDRLTDEGGALAGALEWAETVASYDAMTVRMVKEAITATSTALNRTSSFADADQSLLGAMINGGMRRITG